MNLIKDIFVTLKTEDIPLLDMHKRIEKITLMEIWVQKAFSLFERYHRVLDLNDSETDKAKTGINIEEIDICFMSSVSYFIRCFLNQRNSLSLEINKVTTDQTLRDTYKILMDLRNDEYVHWKGARSKTSIKYSFAAPSPTVYEFATNMRADYSETIGPDQNSDQIRSLYRTTLEYLKSRRLKELDAMRQRLAKAEAWSTTNFLNDRGEPIIKKN